MKKRISEYFIDCGLIEIDEDIDKIILEKLRIPYPFPIKCIFKFNVEKSNEFKIILFDQEKVFRINVLFSDETTEELRVFASKMSKKIVDWVKENHIDRLKILFDDKRIVYDRKIIKNIDDYEKRCKGLDRSKYDEIMKKASEIKNDEDEDYSYYGNERLILIGKDALELVESLQNDGLGHYRRAKWMECQYLFEFEKEKEHLGKFIRDEFKKLEYNIY